MAPQCVYRSLMHCMSRIPGKFACRIPIQEIGFALPVTITVPVVISLLITFWGLRFENLCHFNDIIPNYLFFKPPDFEDLAKFITDEVRNHCLLQKMCQDGARPALFQNYCVVLCIVCFVMFCVLFV